MGRKAVDPMCCVMHVKEPRTLIVKERGLALLFLDSRLEHPAGWICAHYKSSVLLCMTNLCTCMCTFTCVEYLFLHIVKFHTLVGCTINICCSWIFNVQFASELTNKFCASARYYFRWKSDFVFCKPLKISVVNGPGPDTQINALFIDIWSFEWLVCSVLSSFFTWNHAVVSWHYATARPGISARSNRWL